MRERAHWNFDKLHSPLMTLTRTLADFPYPVGSPVKDIQPNYSYVIERVKSMHRHDISICKRLTSVISVIWLRCTTNPQTVKDDSRKHMRALRGGEKLEKSNCQFIRIPMEYDMLSESHVKFIDFIYMLKIVEFIIDWGEKWRESWALWVDEQHISIYVTWRCETHSSKNISLRWRKMREVRKIANVQPLFTFNVLSSSSHHHSSSFPIIIRFKCFSLLLACRRRCVHRDVVHVHTTQPAVVALSLSTLNMSNLLIRFLIDFKRHIPRR